MQVIISPLKSGGHEKSSIDWQELKNRIPFSNTFSSFHFGSLALVSCDCVHTQSYVWFIFIMGLPTFSFLSETPYATRGIIVPHIWLTHEHVVIATALLYTIFGFYKWRLQLRTALLALSRTFFAALFYDNSNNIRHLPI